MTAEPLRIFHPTQQDYCTFEETSAQTNGERSVLLIELDGGGGNLHHRHHTYDEHLEVVEGRLGVRIDRERRILEPGDTAHVPRGTYHHFHSVDGEPATFRVTLTPGHTGFEQSLCILYGLARDGQANANGIPRRLNHLALVAEMGEMEAAGPLRLLKPLFRFLAGRARRRGVEAELVARYAGDLPG